MKFLVPPRTRLAADVSERAYFAGMEEIPWQARVLQNADALLVDRAEFDSGNFFVPYGVEGYGEYVLSTASLMERDAPYHLPVELARGTLNRLRNQLATWESMGMQAPPELIATMAAAHEHLSWATTRQQDADEAARRADQAIRSAMEGIWTLSHTYVAHALAARRQQSGKLTTLWGVNLGATVPTHDVAAALLSAFDTVQVPFAWRDIEVSEGKRDWTISDQQIEWCRASGLKVCGGPLLGVDKGTMPDWMYLWGEDDAESFRACAAEHVQAVVDRYRGKVHLWICAARLNVENDFGHGEDDRLRLAVMAIDNIRRADPRSPIVLSIDQPWGSFMGRTQCDLSPLHFADALVRAELGLSGIGLEINFGYTPGGTEPRDPLEFGRQLDRFSTLGLPLLVSLVVPSGATADPKAFRADSVVPYAAGPPSSASQRDWAETFLGVLLARQPVQGVIWNQLLDSRPHALAHGGLFDERDKAKPIVEVFGRLRREHLT